MTTWGDFMGILGSVVLFVVGIFDGQIILYLAVILFGMENIGFGKLLMTKRSTPMEVPWVIQSVILF